LALQEHHPEIYCQFMSGNFAVSKSTHKFSSMAIDQVHEQLNAVIKGDGGAVGLTENEAALCRWTVTGPEIVRLLNDFESDLCDSEDDATDHHEQAYSIQNRFRHDVEKMMDVFDNEVPFSVTTGEDLIALLTHTIADPSVSHGVRKAQEIGCSQYNKFVDERLRTSSVSLLSPLARNKLHLFSYKSSAKKHRSSNLKLSELKTDCELTANSFLAYILHFKRVMAI